MRTAAIRVVVASACTVLLLSGAAAAELKTFATIAVQTTLEDLMPKLEATTGNKLVVSWATAAMLSKRVQDGEAADVLILTKPVLDALSKEGKAIVGSDAVFASSGVAVGVRSGAPKPDISTSAAFKRALLEAKTVAYSNPASGAASGVYISKLLERLGIAEEMKAKTKFPPPGGFAANLLVSGEAELAIQQEPEIAAVAGVERVGSLPAELNNVTVFAVGLGTDPKHEESGHAVIKFLHSPDAIAALRAHGITPEKN